MEYEEFISKALRGRSVNLAAKELGVTQTTLNNYVRGTRLPTYKVAGQLAKEAGVSLGEAMEILIAKEASKSTVSETFAAGFRLLADAKKRLFSRTYVPV